MCVKNLCKTICVNPMCQSMAICANLCQYVSICVYVCTGPTLFLVNLNVFASAVAEKGPSDITTKLTR